MKSATAAKTTPFVNAAWFGSRPATSNKTFGYYRLEILAAFTNGVVLAAVALFIFYEAYARWFEPPELKRGGVMTAGAAGGPLVNLACAWLLAGGRGGGFEGGGALLRGLGGPLGSVRA